MPTEDLREFLYQPAKDLVEKMESMKDKMTLQELVQFEQLKFSLKMYELSKRTKGESI